MTNKSEDPEWNAARQREYRKKYPDKYNYMLARYYARKLTKEKRAELFKELEAENG